MKVRFEDHGKIYVIKRNIQGSVVDLREEGAARALYASKEDIDAFMTDLIGLHPRLYNKVIFIEQEHLDDVLMDTHAKRADFFNDLFDGTVTDKLRELLQTYIQRIPIFQDNTEEKERLYAAIANERKEATKIQAETTKLTTALANQPTIEELAALIVRPLQEAIDMAISNHETHLERLKSTIATKHGMQIPAFITSDRASHNGQHVQMLALETSVADFKTQLTSH